MTEIWNYALDCGGRYKVSNFGRVARVFSNRETVLKFSKNSRYFKVAYIENGVRKTFSVHRMVAKVFISNLERKPCINHKDGNKHNNHVDNLEWCTVAENNKHAALIGLVQSGSDTYNAVLSDEEVRIIRSAHHSDRVGNVAKMFGVSGGVISNVLKNKTYKGVKADRIGDVWNRTTPNRCGNCKHFSENGKRYGFCGLRSEEFKNVKTGDMEIIYTQVSSIFICPLYQSKFKVKSII